jgi:anti-sigma B factor antagonist
MFAMALSKTDELLVEQQLTPEGFLVIKVAGWITLKNKAAFESAADRIDGNDTILDLSELQYMDSAGLGALLKAYVAVQKTGARIVLAGVLPRVRDLLQLTKTDALFQVYPSTDEAVAALAHVVQP